MIESMAFTSVAVGLVLLIVLIVLSGLRVNQEYERGVFFRLGRMRGIKGPGLFWLVPLLDRSQKVDTRTITTMLATQETVTRDGLAVKINAVIWFQALDVAKVVLSVESWKDAVVQAAETALRDAIGQNNLDDLLQERVKVNGEMLTLLSARTAIWGVSISAVEIKDLDIPEQMQRALAREAEAIREKRARIIKAEGEYEASRKLAEAAAVMASTPGALELRRLQTLNEIGVEHNSTIVLAVPMEAMGSALAASRAGAHQPML